ncbi:putative ATP-dependent permease [Cladorrhinum sp. PSN259]|nr:putative ATP-dependent permease [Cladorrhinum sp. PSN259]
MALRFDDPTWWWDRLWPCYSCCRNIWIPSLATFGPECLGVIGHVPLWMALLTVTLRYGVLPLLDRHRPVWLRRFAPEELEKPVSDGDQEVGGSMRAPRKAWSIWVMSLLLLCSCSIAVGALGASIWSNMTQVFLTPLIPSVVSGLVLVLERPQTAPYSILLIQGTTALVNLALYLLVPKISRNEWSQPVAWVGGVLFPSLSVAVILGMPLRDPHLDNIRIGKPGTQPNSNVSSPEDVITLWQWMTVSWIWRLLKLASQRQLNAEDVWLLPAENQHGRLHTQFRELKGTVLGRLLKANGLDLVLLNGLGFIKMSLDLADPILLKQLLGALTSNTTNDRIAVTYAAITFVARLARAQVEVFYLWFGRRAYERCRGELFTMTYEKTLRRKAFTSPHHHTALKPTSDQGDTSSENISTTTTVTDSGSQASDRPEEDKPIPTRFERLCTWLHRGYRILRPHSHHPKAESGEDGNAPSSTGKILNLFQSDIYIISQRFWDVADITTKPLTFIISVILIWHILGPAALSGVCILLVSMFINSFIIKSLLRREVDRRKTSDQKQEETNQFVEHIRHLRWYDWQGTWLARILKTREAELMKRVTTGLLTIAIRNVTMLGSFLFPVAAFFAYTMISRKPLTVDIAFPALSLFEMLQSSLTSLPGLVSTLINARISMQRVEAFMLEPDKEDEDWKAWVEGDDQDGPPGKLEISMTNSSFSWPESTKEVLKNVAFSCQPGLTMVCGKVGIGKTAFLESILGELDQHGGDKTAPHEDFAYCTQTTWLQSMSIRENILFSAGYDSSRYEQVIDACCLREDFSLFRSRDLTMVGENGVGLSGGQKARVALARAIYSRARILLLDDPIAALDHHTATSVMQKLFSNKNSSLMAGRLVVFVTHRVDIVKPYAYQVIEVGEHGRVETFSLGELENNERLKHLAAIVAPQEESNTASNEESQNAKPDHMIEEEYRAHGGIMLSVYWRFIKAGKLHWWMAVIACFVSYRLAKIAFFWFIKEWGNAYGEKPAVLHSIHTLGFGSDARGMERSVVSQHIFQVSMANRTIGEGWLGQHLPRPDENVKPWLLGFTAFSLFQFFAMLSSDIMTIIITYTTGRNIFSRAITRVANATFRFYDITPVGRLMNRLTSDMERIDGGIAPLIMNVAWEGLGWVSSIVVIATITPPFLIISICMSALFVYAFSIYLPASQSLRRLETVSLSPMFSNFTNLINGLTTIRAFRAQPHFQAQNIVCVDGFQRMDHFYWSVQAWLEYRYIILSAVTTFALTLTAIYSGLSSGNIAFVLASAANFVRCTQSLCQTWGNLQMQFVSVERVVELLKLEKESDGSVLPPAAWPVYGDDIVFDDVTLRYAPHLEPVLKDVTFTIPGGSNVAVTGRTGSGKTTLVYSLLSTLQPDADTGGAIYIGPVDLATVNKHALRRSITYVAQDPVLFAGTLRDNLDPLKKKTDAECETILKHVFGEGQGEFTLLTDIGGGGRNLSQGQRQLVGLARAILRQSPVVVMDEATASIDHETAAKIHRLLRDELKQSTVITIAHRVEAVADADFEIVMDRGRVVKAGPRVVAPAQQ